MTNRSLHDLHETVRDDLSSIGEEVANAISHGLGAVLGLVSLPVLIFFAHRSGNGYVLTGSVIYAISYMMVFLSSTLYHATLRPGLRKFFQILDHISIYFLIAGTYTPFIFIHLRDGAGWTIFLVLWVLTAIGSALKVFFTGRFTLLSLLMYLAMGWMVVFIFDDVLNNVPYDVLVWMITGGVAYTLGTVFYAVKRIPFNHFIWHLFVLAGALSHLWAVFLSVRG